MAMCGMPARRRGADRLAPSAGRIGDGDDAAGTPPQPEHDGAIVTFEPAAAASMPPSASQLFDSAGCR